ncbi:MAG: CDP-alcohol phosphatidyltransferase family protein [Proteobacteria bacterium]|jgi:CDP-diacylglycerol--glycerol-3-phosphate 3-phosphatidyltransferase|nr:CDP-alcohol phosphatidyltransferase family protein [Pseudomonadota bacterium]
MPSIYDLKPRFQALLRPVVSFLASNRVTANQVTLSAVGISLIAGLCLYRWPTETWALLLIPVTLFIRMALNAIDGLLAREHQMQSHLGAILNELGDVISDAALYLPFAVIPGIEPALVVVIVILATISEMTGVVAVQIGTQRQYQGPMGKSDRALAFGLLAVLLASSIETGFWINLYLGVVLGLLILTIVNRARSALAEVNV